MPPINVLIKPASGSCNLKCRYCFYSDVINNRDTKNYGMMSLDTLENLVKRAFEYGDHFVGFAFQGGEPTLVGLDFYRNLIRLQQKYNTKKLKISNSIQTNGILIDKEWAQFLSENQFLVGLSLDGTKELNDNNRIHANGEGSFGQIWNAVTLFQQYKVDFNILCVVTKQVAKHIGKNYRFYKKCGFEYLQFIPCLDDLGKVPGTNPYSLTPQIYGDFLKDLFDLWYLDVKAGNRISIRMFDNILQMISGYHPESCDMMGRCSANAVVEADGSVYPCDFYVTDQWKLGNLREHTLADLLRNDVAMRFIKISAQRPKECYECEYKAICRGGCRRHYEPIQQDVLLKNYFCQSYQEFYEYALPRFYEIVRRLSKPMN